MKTFMESLVSESTRKSYRHGLKSFEEWYGKPIEELLGEEDPSKTIERYYVVLRQKHCQNTCRVKVNPIVQFLKYNNVDVKLRKGLGVYRTEVTTRDHILTVDQARSIFKVSGLEDKVLVKAWLLGLRISDASRLEWKDFDFEPTEDLKEVQLLTKKEGIVAHCFLDSEFQNLLAKYIPTLKQENPCLFQSERNGRLSEKQLLRRLQKLAGKAGIKPKGRFGWHIARKLFLRTATELGVNQWSAKMMVGKAVDKSIATYINGVSLTKDAQKISNVLRMETQAPIEDTENLREALASVEKENRVQKTRIDNLQETVSELESLFEIENLKKIFEKILDSYIEEQQ